jgi:Uma2 family endonuclease
MKLRAYAGAGVKECWFVLGPEKQIEVFRNPSNGSFAEQRTYAGSDILTSAALPNFSLKVDELFAE